MRGVRFVGGDSEEGGHLVVEEGYLYPHNADYPVAGTILLEVARAFGFDTGREYLHVLEEEGPTILTRLAGVRGQEDGHD